MEPPLADHASALAALETTFIILGLALALVLFDFSAFQPGRARIPASPDWPMNWAALAN